jgi:hypothetical protein
MSATASVVPVQHHMHVHHTVSNDADRLASRPYTHDSEPVPVARQVHPDRVGCCMANVERSGRGSRTRPVVVEAPVLVPTLSEGDRAVGVSVLTEIIAAWRLRHQIADGEPDA